MRTALLFGICVMMSLGLALGFGYYGNDYGYGSLGSYGKYGQSEVFYTLDNQSGGFNNGLFVTFLIVLFLISLIVNTNLFNISSSAPAVSFNTAG